MDSTESKVEVTEKVSKKNREKPYPKIKISKEEKRAIKAVKKAMKKKQRKESKKKLRRNVRYIPPNAITTAGIFFGYLSIIMSVNKEWKYAVYCIIFAMVTDVLDGKTARSLKAFSEFGKELDSFSDSISFGVAPSFFVYFYLNNYYSMKDLSNSENYNHKFDIANLILPVAFVFALCGIMRLVRFNVTTVAKATKDDFTGLPIPCGAGLLISYYLIADAISTDFKVNIDKLFYPEIMMIITVITGFLMVSTVPFASPATVLKKMPKFIIPIFFIVSIVFIRYSIFIIGYTYVIISLLIWVIERKIFEETETKELYIEMSETDNCTDITTDSPETPFIEPVDHVEDEEKLEVERGMIESE